MGRDFKGCYDILRERMIVFEDNPKEALPKTIQCNGLNDPALTSFITSEQHAQLTEDVAMIKGLCPPMDMAAYREGHLTPVFFGSALKNFGVQDLIHSLIDYAPAPRPQPAIPQPVKPDDGKVSGFIFKVQGNMDPKHRDRIAFFRICSGTFKRGMRLFQTRTGKWMAINNPMFFFAQGRELAEDAVAGDIIGIPNHGTLRVGDSLSEGDNLTYTGIPNFAPEILRRIRLDDAMKTKHLQKALESMAEEGVVQVFRPVSGSQWIIGVVGALQLDVLQNRLEIEYGLPVGFEMVPYSTALWVGAKNPKELEKFMTAHRSQLAEDRDGGIVVLPRDQWALNTLKRDWPTITLSATKEMGNMQ